ncbi:hypothetical protein D3C74_265000 [compost metagenome]
MSYPNDLLASRAVVKPGLFAVIPATGLVNNVIPGIEGCKISIVASPKIGAGFVQYVVHTGPGGKTTRPWAKEPGIEAFVYCTKGGCRVSVAGETQVFDAGGYAYAPPGIGIEFSDCKDGTELLLYKQAYVPLQDYASRAYFGNSNDIPYRIFDEMENVFIKDLLPTELGFDMNMHVLSFAPGGCHPFVETHVQEHGAYVLEGEGVYYLDDRWMTIKKDDFIWFGPYVPQASYGVGRGPFTYIYSKDCNRDVHL